MLPAFSIVIVVTVLTMVVVVVVGGGVTGLHRPADQSQYKPD